MGVTTVSSAVHITPVVVKTFFSHGKRKARKLAAGEEDTDPRDDVFFDQAFNIVKSFIELGTLNTVESLQSFTNTRVPAPYWAAVSPITIPLSVCNAAADFLSNWFGPDELTRVVGGERWWQVRGLDGVDAEWITEKDYLDDADVEPPAGRKLTDEEKNILTMEHLETVMLYVHGGGFFWGSINTHRYQIIRYARKIKGRAFAVNYRKAPQYPWPCPLQDVIAAYLYLIDPPASALHKPIDPSKIVFAGDSAGGNLCITVLTILRDLGMPMPSGAVLISPWVDLTHGFPSIMENTPTDIIPQYGFLAKPSTLWPVDLIPPKGGRVVPTQSNPPPKPGMPDTLRPSPDRLNDDDEGSHPILNQDQMLQSKTGDWEAKADDDTTLGQPECSHWEPRPPKVLMKDPNATPLELRSQIQLYATTEQLTHPLVSPVLQGSLGNLPPLYILAGDGEVLRDEIIYLAHKAAHPEEYPTRTGVLRDSTRQATNAKKFTTPTKVHLQVFDGMCHVLTVFSFCENVNYAYRSIAQFVKNVTSEQPAKSGNPFPEFNPPSEISSSDEDEDPERKETRKPRKSPFAKLAPRPANEDDAVVHNGSDVHLYKDAANAAVEQIMTGKIDMLANDTNGDADHGDDPIRSVLMLRERVDIHGRVRTMEPKEEIRALQVQAGEVGLIKEEPTLRWLRGQEIWDKKFKMSAHKSNKKRRKIEAKAQHMIDNARDQGFQLVSERHGLFQQTHRRASVTATRSEEKVDGTIQVDRRYGPFDLDDERPPPTAIAKRRDTPESLALLKKTIYHSAPITHATVPKPKPSDAIRAAFDPHDDPARPPKQSVSEQQVKTHIIPMHGLRIWDALVGYFMRESTKRAANGAKKTAAALKNATTGYSLTS